MNWIEPVLYPDPQTRLSGQLGLHCGGEGSLPSLLCLRCERRWHHGAC